MATNKTSNIYIRIEPEVKKEAEKILSSLGIGASQAVNMFYKQIILRGGMPFDVVVPNNKIVKIKQNETIIKEENNNEVKISEVKKDEVIQNEELNEDPKEREKKAIEEIKKKYGL